jgi:sugar permease
MKHVRRICAVLLAAVVLLPIVLLCVQAFVPPFDALMISTGSVPLRLLPIPFSAEQWQMLFNQSTYWQAFWNSLIWTVGACVVQVMVAFLGGYVLAKYPARWCVAIAGLYTLMMLMPPQMTLLPIYRVAYANKLLNHPMLLYAPIAFAPFGTFFMRQWLLRWPDELTEYLRLEGGSSVKLLWYCLAPYALPGMLALFALTFTEGWNQVEQPLMLVSDSLRQPLSALLKDLSAGNPQIVFAASVASILPIALVMLAVLVQQGSKRKAA